MQLRAQFAVEMFFAFTFAVLLLFWLVNYYQLFSDTVDLMPLQSGQKLITRDLAKLVNEVCIMGGNPEPGSKSLSLLIDSPCLQQRSVSWYYNVTRSADGSELRVSSDATNFTSSRRVSCRLETNTNLTRCGAFSKLCIYKMATSGGQKQVMITTDAGEC